MSPLPTPDADPYSTHCPQYPFIASSALPSAHLVWFSEKFLFSFVKWAAHKGCRPHKRKSSNLRAFPQAHTRTSAPPPRGPPTRLLFLQVLLGDNSQFSLHQFPREFPEPQLDRTDVSHLFLGDSLSPIIMTPELQEHSAFSPLSLKLCLGHLPRSSAVPYLPSAKCVSPQRPHCQGVCSTEPHSVLISESNSVNCPIV